MCVAQDALSFSTWLVNDASYEAWVPAIVHLTNIRGLLFNDAGAPLLEVSHLALIISPHCASVRRI